MWQSDVSPQDTVMSPFASLFKSDFHVWGDLILVEVTVYVQHCLLIFSRDAVIIAQYCHFPTGRSSGLIFNPCVGSLSRSALRIIVSTSCIFPTQGHLRVSRRACIYTKAPRLFAQGFLEQMLCKKMIFWNLLPHIPRYGRMKKA